MLSNQEINTERILLTHLHTLFKFCHLGLSCHFMRLTRYLLHLMRHLFYVILLDQDLVQDYTLHFIVIIPPFGGICMAPIWGHTKGHLSGPKLYNRTFFNGGNV